MSQECIAESHSVSLSGLPRLLNSKTPALIPWKFCSYLHHIYVVVLQSFDLVAAAPLKLPELFLLKLCIAHGLCHIFIV